MSDEEDIILSSPETQQLSREVESVTARLDRVMGELDSRRHGVFEVVDLTSGLRRYAWWILGAAVVAGGGVTAALVVRRRRQRPLRRLASSWAATREKWGGALPVRVSFGSDERGRGGKKRQRPAASSILVSIALSFASGAAAVLGRRLTESWAAAKRI